MLSGGDPVVGHIRDFSRDPCATMDRGARECGEVFRLNLFGNSIVVILGPEGNEAVFRAPEDVLSPKEAYRLMTPIFGAGIAYDAEPHIMDEQLAFLYPALSPARMKTYGQIMAEETEKYIANWGDSGEIDVLDMMNELTMYISSRCLLGPEFRGHLNREFADLYQALEGGLTPLAYFFPNLPVPKFKKRDKARLRLQSLLGGVISERRKREFRGDDFLQTLMEASYKDGRPLTENEITGLLLTIVFAGHHTSGTLAAWTAINLLQHPQYLSGVLSELDRVYGKNPKVTVESLKELDALERAIMEAERMYPPIVMMMRKVISEFKFGKYVFPKGTFIMVSPQVSQRLRRVFKDPNRYDPERFAPPRSEHKQHPFTMTSFGGGKHKCIGFQFAYMQIKTAWSIILRKFELELASHIYTPSYDFLIAGPHHPCLIKYRRR
jgi:sterol 14-demethylase